MRAAGSDDRAEAIPTGVVGTAVLLRKTLYVSISKNYGARQIHGLIDHLL
jgi:hypothetical protein